MGRTAFLTALLALAAGLAACGGGGTGGGTTPTLSAIAATLRAFTPAPAPTVENIPQPTVQGVPTVTASGLKIYDVQIGTGTAAKAGDSITVTYTGWFADGTTFDSSSFHGNPASFPLGRFIPGWQEGVPGMKVGGKRRLIIPPALAYGASGRGSIPPNATLTFDIGLVSIP
jgi:FKBP-type peptidyl-prolyl cis-trans isomerase FkpA